MNTKAKYTKGPWHIGTSPGPIIYGPQGEQIANMLPCMLERNEHNANVRLMTASPKLLAALEIAITTIERLATRHGAFTSVKGTLDVAHAAIAEATGQK